MTFKYANLFTILFHHIKCNVMEKINIQLPQYWKKKKLNPEFIKELESTAKSDPFTKDEFGVALLSKLK